MSNRFSNLKSSNSTESRTNIFMQNPKPYNQQRQQRYKHQHHRFRSNNFHTVKTPQFQIKPESFPALVPTTIPANNTNYMSKIKSLPKTFHDKPKIPKGYVILRKGETSFKPKLPSATPSIIDEMMPTRHCAELIFANRQKYRDELNEIMGDISPYWITEDNNNEDDYSDDGWYSEEDNLILDEW
jgi:hypothetical protein